MRQDAYAAAAAETSRSAADTTPLPGRICSPARAGSVAHAPSPQIFLLDYGTPSELSRERGFEILPQRSSRRRDARGKIGHRQDNRGDVAASRRKVRAFDRIRQVVRAIDRQLPMGTAVPINVWLSRPRTARVTRTNIHSAAGKRVTARDRREAMSLSDLSGELTGARAVAGNVRWCRSWQLQIHRSDSRSPPEILGAATQ